MGRPEHYSRDIVSRCRSLIRNLMPNVLEGLPDDARHGGPLQTTFLLAMATPMIVLPIERMFKPAEPNPVYVADDRELDQDLAKDLDDVFGNGKTFGNAPFVSQGTWSYVQARPPFNIAEPWPHDLLEALSGREAARAADAAPARRLMLDLRNALAHGGVVYLDKNGFNAYGQAEMFAFVGAVMQNRRVSAINILRIHQIDFALFLEAWADWLARQPNNVIDVLNARSPVAA